MPNMKDLSLRIKKLWPMLKFFDGQTDRQTEWQTDRVITIGHPPSKYQDQTEVRPWNVRSESENSS